MIDQMTVSLILAVSAGAFSVAVAVKLTSRLTTIEKDQENMKTEIQKLHAEVREHRTQQNNHTSQFATIIERLSHMSMHIKELRESFCRSGTDRRGCKDLPEETL